MFHILMLSLLTINNILKLHLSTHGVQSKPKTIPLLLKKGPVDQKKALRWYICTDLTLTHKVSLQSDPGSVAIRIRPANLLTD